MKIDYNFMNPDALKRTYLLCKARKNISAANEIEEVMKKRGIAIPGFDDGKNKITFSTIK